ncbi:MAG TPA: trypsin-like peptidase domain-containing protein, partial [Candidatus Glassbacteria bacterium]|nr:trypsin-like peptidase domain-containing protein [Candidatus Glassbacteria bacterium]
SARGRSGTVVNMGSGVIVSTDGYILTSNHVITGAENIKVMLLDGRTYDADVIGTDHTTDLAVLKAQGLEPGAKLPAIRFGDSDSCRIGAWVMAIGNPMELGISVTAGIISAKSRKIDILSENPLNIEGSIDQSIESFIQTDAVINPGNSGGALANLAGELIGINTAIASQTGMYQGYGFAIPINLARRVMEDLIEYGRVIRPVLGVVIQSLDPVRARALGLESPQGVLVEDFSPREGSPASRAGILRGDVIVAVDGRQVNYTHQLQETIAKFRPGEVVKVRLFRNGQYHERQVLLGSKEISSQREAPAPKVSLPRTSTLGMELRSLNQDDLSELGLEESRGVVVERVNEGGLAATSGMQAGDVILKVDQKEVNSVQDVSNVLDDVSPGTAVLFMVVRGGTTHFVGLEIP